MFWCFGILPCTFEMFPCSITQVKLSTQTTVTETQPAENQLLQMEFYLEEILILIQQEAFPKIHQESCIKMNNIPEAVNWK